MRGLTSYKLVKNFLVHGPKLTFVIKIEVIHHLETKTTFTRLAHI